MDEGSDLTLDPRTIETPRRLFPLRPHPMHKRLMHEPYRFKVVPAGRRSGKTELAKRKIAVSAMSAYTPWPDPRFFGAAPTRDQAKAIFWNDLKAMYPPALIKMGHAGISESDLRITLQNGAETYVVGMDKPQRIEGRSWDGGVLDEFANMKPGAWGENVRPALSDRKGWAWLIGVPEGRNHYYDIHRYAISGVDPDWMSYTWPSREVLDPAEVEAARRQLDELVFQQEYEASFVNFEGRAYYPFLEATHTAKLKYDDKQPLIFTFDFNVAPGTAAVIQEQQIPGEYHRDATGAVLLDKPVIGSGVIGEVYIPANSNTEAVCRRLIKDWGAHRGIVRCYGDATGGAQGSAQTEGSDWDIIRRILNAHFRDRVYFEVPKANPTERARINAVNTRLRTGNKVIRLKVDPAKAPHVVTDFEGVRLLEGGSGEIDKKADPKLTHLTDGIGYYIEREFPIGIVVPETKPLRA